MQTLRNKAQEIVLYISSQELLETKSGRCKKRFRNRDKLPQIVLGFVFNKTIEGIFEPLDGATLEFKF